MTDASTSEANTALSLKILHDFNRNMDGWFDHFHDDVVVEFAFSESIDVPAKTVGKAANTALFQAILEDVRVQFYDIQPQPLADPNKVVVEYKSRGGTPERPYYQKYICLHEFRDGKLIGFREYFDTFVVKQAFSSLASLHVE